MLMIQYESEYNLLIGKHTIRHFNIIIILLTEDIHAYIVEQEDKFNLYLAEVKGSTNAKVELFKTFNMEKEALEYAKDNWSCRLEVQDYIQKFNHVRLKKATKKQVMSTNGEATNYGETTWFFARRICYHRLKSFLGIPGCTTIEDFKK